MTMRALLALAVLWRDLQAYRRYIRINGVVFGVTWVVGMVLVTDRAYLGLVRLLFPGGDAGEVTLTVADLALHNGAIAAVTMLGAATLGLLPLAIVAYNGVSIGAIAMVSIVQLGPTGALVLLLPHGVLEIPAILVAAAVGTGLPFRAVGGDARTELWRAARLAAVVFLALLLAAVIEARVTGTIAASVDWT